MVKTNRNASTPKKKAENTVFNTNQKKTRSQSPTREPKNTHRVSVYKNEFMKKFIIPTDSTEDQFNCKICPNKPLLQRKNVYSHITDSLKHKDAVSSRDQEEHNNLIKLLLKKRENNIESRGKERVDYKERVKSYLKFLAFCFKQRMSFEQISSVGLHIKMQSEKIEDEKKVKNEDPKKEDEKDQKALFTLFSFDSEEIGKVARLLGDYILKELKEDLKSRPFSLIIDNVTVCRENICGIKVRYLKSYKDSSGFTRTRIENRMLGLKYLEESSTAATHLNIVKEKLFSLDSNIIKNLVGYAHDAAATLSGESAGLGVLLNEERNKFIFDLIDPCHILSLSLKKSIDVLDNETTDFIQDINDHFRYPQRLATLQKIEKENDFPALAPVEYVESRWLSLGSSLTRLLKIWDTILLYMQTKPNVKSVKKINYDEFIELMESKRFKCQITFLASFIERRLNKISLTFQNQELEIQNLKKEILQCINDISRLFISPEFITDNISEMNAKFSGDINTIKPFLLSKNLFFKNIITDIDSNLNDLKTLSHEDQIDFTEIMQKFLAKLLYSLLSSLPQNSVIETLDFVDINLPHDTFKERILTFNKTFHIVPIIQTPELIDEINNLYSQNLFWQRNTAKDSSLYLWDLVNNSASQNENKTIYPMLSSIFRVAHSLPTSSACIEQSFSYLKLFKNQQRNSLNEKTLESLMLLKERSEDDILISDQLVEMYIKMRDEANKRKDGKSKSPQNQDEDKESSEINPFADLRNIEDSDSESSHQQGPRGNKKRKDRDLIAGEDLMDIEASSLMKQNNQKRMKKTE